METTFLGIDPGLEGCIAQIAPDCAGATFYDLPTVETIQGKKKRRRVDSGALAAILRSVKASNPRLHATVESVHAMPKQGVASSFSFGQGFGMILGMLAALEIPHTLVDPRRWTGALLRDMAKGDEAAVLRASQLYPDVAGDLRTPRGRLLLGRADALLLAHFTKEKL